MAEQEPEPQPPLKSDTVWVKIQENTFVNWINQQLRDTDYTITTLEGAFNDGVKLCALVAALQGQQKITGMKKNVKNRHQMIENVTLALNACKADKVKTVNIGPEDIVNGNMKLVMGLLWSFILRYQIGKSKVPPKQLMLAWIRAVIPECNINNFTTDWNDGKALSALIDYCEPGLCPAWRSVNPSDREHNCENAMRLAQERLGVPMVLSPADMASADLDQLSGMTYLSYFMKLNSCGYKATLRDINRIITPKTVHNFEADWRDGSAISNLVHSVGGHIPGWPDLPTYDQLHCTKIAIQSAKEIGIIPILKAEEMINQHEGHLGVMAVAAQFVHKKAIKKPASQLLEIIFNSVDISVGQRASYNLVMRHGDPTLHTIDASITDASGASVPTNVEWNTDITEQAKGIFVPASSGTHKLTVSCDGEVIRGCPITFNVAGGQSLESLTLLPMATGIVNKLAAIEVVGEAGSEQNLKVICTSSSGRVRELELLDLPVANGRTISNNLVPDEIGEWNIEIKRSNGDHINGSPHKLNVINPPSVDVHSVEGTTLIGSPVHFSVDTENAGESELKCQIDQEGRIIPCEIVKLVDHRYKVTFVPQGVGVHHVSTSYGGIQCQDRPFKIVISDSNLVEVAGKGIKEACVNEVAYFNVQTKNAGAGILEVVIRDPQGVILPTFEEDVQANGTHQIQYTPATVGTHEIDVNFTGKAIKGSPFKVQVYNPNLTVNIPEQANVGETVSILLATTNCGKGSLQISVMDQYGETISVETKRLSHERYQARFTPKRAGDYAVEMDFNSTPIKGSPWRIRAVTATVPPPPPSAPPVEKPQRIPVRFTRSFEISGNKDVKVVIMSPTGQEVPFKTVVNSETHKTIKYQLTEVGDHKIHLTKETQPVRGSPFPVQAFNADLVRVHGWDTGDLGQPVKLTIDTRQAGVGDVEVKVQGAPNNVEMAQTGIYNSAFISPQPCKIDVLFNNIHVRGSPFKYPVTQPAIRMEIPQTAPLHKPVKCTLLSSNTSAESLSVSVTEPDGTTTPTAALRPTGQKGQGTFDFFPTKIGTYTVNVSHGDHVIESAAYSCKVVDVNLPKLDMRDGEVNTESLFIVYHNNCGTSDVRARVFSSSNEELTVRYQNEGTYTRVLYTPKEPGPHRAQIFVGLLEVPESPRYINIKGTTPNPEASGDGLCCCVQDRPASFVINMRGTPGTPDVRIEGPKSVAKCEIAPIPNPPSTDNFKVTYVPVETGFYTIHISLNGQPIQGSPFNPIILDPRKVKIEGSWEAAGPQGPDSNTILLTVGKPKTLELVEDHSAGPGELKVKGTHDTKNDPLKVSVLENNKRYQVILEAQHEGRYSLMLSWSGFPIPGTPSSALSRPNYEMNGAGNKVLVQGQGVRTAIANEETEFIIDGSNGPAGRPEVMFQESTLLRVDANASLINTGSNIYKCVYTLPNSGQYIINVLWPGRQVDGNPFTLAVTDLTSTLSSQDSVQTGIEGIRVTGPGIDHGILFNYRGEFSVDASAVGGRGKLSLSIRDPTGAELRYSMTSNSENSRQRDFSYDPKVVGVHVIDLVWNGQRLPICPINIQIFDARDELEAFQRRGELPFNRRQPFSNGQNGITERRFISNNQSGINNKRSQSYNQNRQNLLIQAAPRRVTLAQDPRLGYRPYEAAPGPLRSRAIKSSFMVPDNAPARRPDVMNMHQSRGVARNLAVFK